MEAMLQLSDIRMRFETGAVPVEVLQGVSFSITNGEFVAITGPSGSGKSTLLHIIGGLLTPSQGSYQLMGRQVNAFSSADMVKIRQNTLGFVFQDFLLLPRLNIFENIELPLVYRGMPRSERKERVCKIAERLGIEHRLNHNIMQISGGEKQRVAICRALVGNPSVILADEPTGNLDSKNSRVIMELFQNLNQEGMTIVLITHEHAIASYCKRQIRILDGKITFDGPVSKSPDTLLKG